MIMMEQPVAAVQKETVARPVEAALLETAEQRALQVDRTAGQPE